MKKIFLLFLLVLLLKTASPAQPYKTSAGLRIGFPYGLTVKHFVDRYNAFELIAAANIRGYIVAGLFENEHRINNRSGVYLYWGLGVHGGFVDGSKNTFVYMKETYIGPVAGVDAVVGIDYSLRKIPLNLSFDLIPGVNLAGYTGWNGLNAALSLRYVF
jgi:hypothetical protein